MAISALPHPSPAGVVTEACGQLHCLDETLWAARTDEELVTTVEALQQMRSEVAALEAEALAEIDHRDLAKKQLGWGSTADWFTHLAGLRRGQGTRAIDHAKQLTTQRPATLARLRAGAISPEQAAVVLDALDHLPSGAGVRAEGETLMLDEATRLNATDLHKAGRHLIEVIDPDRTERRLEADLDREDRAAHLHRFLSITEDGAGGVRLKGRGSLEDAATLRAALLPLTAPVPVLDPVTCEELPDPRDHGTRMWDALVVTANHALTTELPPRTHAARPRISVTISLDTLREGLGTGETDDGLELTGSVIRRLACDADVLPIVLGSRSEVLDVGRLQRLVTAALWRALVARDQHCVFPGCSRPPLMCHAHHIIHWANDGPTSLDNLVLLCGHHHRLIHDSPWQIRLSPDDKRPEFRPPPRGTTQPAWTRHRPRRE